MSNCVSSRAVRRRQALQLKTRLSVHSAGRGQLLTGSQTLLDHSHNRCDVLECSRMRFAVQVAQIEHHDAQSSEFTQIRFLIGVDVSDSLDSA
jgi:hypothetical protein